MEFYSRYFFGKEVTFFECLESLSDSVYFIIFFCTLITTVLLLIFKYFRKGLIFRNSRTATSGTKDYRVNPAESFMVALEKTRSSLQKKLSHLISRKSMTGEEFFLELEEILISADVGVRTTSRLIELLKQESDHLDSPAEKIERLREFLLHIFEKTAPSPEKKVRPYVLMVVGVNGVGKTTTIGKISSRIFSTGKTSVLAAADTFRAAAIEQLSVWAERSHSKLIQHRSGSDPSAVVFDAIKHALSNQNVDYVIADTAGRLHTKKNLMEELKKVKKTIKKLISDAPHEILLVLDATTGQNALQQAKLFHEALHIDSIAITKLDGSARGGILVQIASELEIPVKYVGLGESANSLRAFDPKLFLDSLLGPTNPPGR